MPYPEAMRNCDTLNIRNSLHRPFGLFVSRDGRFTVKANPLVGNTEFSHLPNSKGI